MSHTDMTVSALITDKVRANLQDDDAFTLHLAVMDRENMLVRSGVAVRAPDLLQQVVNMHHRLFGCTCPHAALIPATQAIHATHGEIP